MYVTLSIPAQAQEYYWPHSQFVYIHTASLALIELHKLTPLQDLAKTSWNRFSEVDLKLHMQYIHLSGQTGNCIYRWDNGKFSFPAAHANVGLVHRNRCMHILGAAI